LNEAISLGRIDPHVQIKRRLSDKFLMAETTDSNERIVNVDKQAVLQPRKLNAERLE
jgi:hypothetical protein